MPSISSEAKKQIVDQLKFDSQGLIPAVVQDWRTGTVLMMGFMNQEALDRTLETKFVHFWSRKRERLWQKGEESGNHLQLKRLFVDCDGDTLLVKAEPMGPTCHTGSRSCFFSEISETGIRTEPKTEDANGTILDLLYEMVLTRKLDPKAESYVASLLQGGDDRVLKKVTEEAGEVLLAVKNHNQEEIVYEVADLLFHTMVTLGHCGVPFTDVQAELGRRFGRSGFKKKSES
ncbi:bifunctional phosphoribosyl-AMP cyclohydrolase/phosphoribosyl-ATP diphosphatase HisIE [Candidatus Nitronereus thalassa]|uniref:Histidine biosynthesis bifunctional protein HisIE n=1 Tax=Candidatus Nitronereus thalassa TaxID=3020898 RepID=A0ABU3KAE4_9BACT|nr:bifunctional phosphoribosyl-AMP cyclohydrolase/phosphoribosyl-ATP diphosphatase HisIE [Candidatus Nitronereus thalassa]MDT7043430.1 bifunctional phosphoribosyl-AMP cyclohydrolase/phosphoribosyl-ATP diphosphatase HisIE [Candidatus Nitronereus thalassa]